MPSKRIPLVGSVMNRPVTGASTTLDDKDQRFENCYPVLYKNPITGDGSAYIVKRLGISGAITGGPGSPYQARGGTCLWTGHTLGPFAVFSFVSGTTLGIYRSGDGAIVGAALSNIAYAPIHITETLVGNGNATVDSYLTLVATKTTDELQHAWYIKENDSSWTEITDSDFPSNQNGTAVGGISGTTLTTASSSTGVNFPVGTILSGSGVSANTKITAIGTAVAGVGTYTVSISQTVAAGTTISGGVQTVGAMVHMDGYAFIMDKFGKIWNSDLNSLSAWTSTSFISASNMPDSGVGLARSGNYIVAFGTTSIEFFQNAGNATGSPLTRVQTLARNIGAVPSGDFYNRTILQVNEDIYFFGIEGNSQRVGVYRLSGTAIRKISNDAIDRLIQADFGNVNTSRYGFAGAFKENGMTHILFSGYSSTCETPVYCVDTNYWWYRKNESGLIVLAIQSETEGTYLTTNESAGKIMGVSGYTDTLASSTAVAFTAMVITKPLDMGTMRLKEFTRFGLVADDQSVSASVTVAWSNNDYSTFNSGKSLSISSVEKSISAGLGWGRRRAWKITDTANRPFRAEAFEVDWEVAEE